MLRASLIVVVLALVTGCASVQKAESDLRAVTLADIDDAIAMAAVAKDAEAPYRLRCYTTLRKYVPTQSVAPALPKGVVSAFELAAETDQQLRAGVGLPQDLRADCSVLLLSTAEFAARLGVKFAPIPGLGAAGGLVPGLK